MYQKKVNRVNFYPFADYLWLFQLIVLIKLFALSWESVVDLTNISPNFWKINKILQFRAYPTASCEVWRFWTTFTCGKFFKYGLKEY